MNKKPVANNVSSDNVNDDVLLFYQLFNYYIKDIGDYLHSINIVIINER